MKSLLVSETLQDDPVQEKYTHIYEKCHRNLTMQCHSYHVLAEPSIVVTSRTISKPNATSDGGELMLTLSAAVPSVSLTSISVSTNPTITTMRREKYVVFRINVSVSDAPIWNLPDVPITDNGSEISADTDSRFDIQHRSNFLPFST